MKRRFWILILTFLVGLVLGMAPGVYIGLDSRIRENNPASHKASQGTASKYDFQNRTPQETLNNFIAGLDSGDLDLIMTFIDPAYEARLNYRDQLTKVLKSQDEKIFLIEKFRRMTPFESDITHDGDYKFILRDKDGKVENIVDMELNKETGKWLIQDF
jgi:hypothetical protein